MTYIGLAAELYLKKDTPIIFHRHARFSGVALVGMKTCNILARFIDVSTEGKLTFRPEDNYRTSTTSFERL
jgi:hypothetical protein